MSEHGLPCWYELATADPAAVQPFYAALLGWQFADSGMAGMTYIIASAQESMVAGLFKAEPEQPTGWSFYITVDNADATAAQAAALGAQVIVPPSDIPDTGRFAVMVDPQGASFAILQPLPDGMGGAFDQQKSGHGNWHDLGVADPQAALEFYGALFGWTVSRAQPMGPEMIYNIIACKGRDIGGIFNDASVTAPAWCVYFGAASINQAVATVKSAGGGVEHDPAEVPGGAFVTHCHDGRGGRFALVGPA
jgi:predicted enzyme related to lactoylglutathione lyase